MRMKGFVQSTLSVCSPFTHFVHLCSVRSLASFIFAVSALPLHSHLASITIYLSSDYQLLSINNHVFYQCDQQYCSFFANGIECEKQIRSPLASTFFCHQSWWFRLRRLALRNSAIGMPHLNNIQKNKHAIFPLHVTIAQIPFTQKPISDIDDR